MLESLLSSAIQNPVTVVRTSVISAVVIQSANCSDIFLAHSSSFLCARAFRLVNGFIFFVRLVPCAFLFHDFPFENKLTRLVFCEKN